jgi:hypothetical protein
MPSEPVRRDHRRAPARAAEPPAHAAADVRLRWKATALGALSSGFVHDFDPGNHGGVMR